MAKPQRVGVAVVEHAGRVLVGLRRDGQTLAGHAEFPGGKCHPNEEPSDCAERECLEETGLPVTAVRLLDHRVHAYSEVTVEISFWLCRPKDEPFANNAFCGFRFVPVRELRELPFPAANRTTIELLTSELT